MVFYWEGHFQISPSDPVLAPDESTLGEEVEDAQEEAPHELRSLLVELFLIGGLYDSEDVALSPICARRGCVACLGSGCLQWVMVTASVTLNYEITTGVHRALDCIEMRIVHCRSRIDWLETQLRVYMVVCAICVLSTVVLFLSYACFWGRWRNGWRTVQQVIYSQNFQNESSPPHS